MNIGDFVCPALKLVVAWMLLERLLCKADSKLIIGPAHIDNDVTPFTQTRSLLYIHDSAHIFKASQPRGPGLTNYMGTNRTKNAVDIQ